jgi:RNA polymerase sigma-70 factor (subfamily 1)
MDLAGGRDFEGFRSYLHQVARLRLDPRLRSKVSPDDLVQQTMLEACTDRAKLDGQTDDELKGWLRRVLLNNIANTLRDLRVGMRDVDREQSLEAILEQSSARLDALLKAAEASPSEQAMANERVLQLEQALAALPESQAEVVTLRHLHDWSLADIAVHVGRSGSATAGLLHRGMQQLKTLLHEED